MASLKNKKLLVGLLAASILAAVFFVAVNMGFAAGAPRLEPAFLYAFGTMNKSVMDITSLLLAILPLVPLFPLLGGTMESELQNIGPYYFTRTTKKLVWYARWLAQLFLCVAFYFAVLVVCWLFGAVAAGFRVEAYAALVRIVVLQYLLVVLEAALWLLAANLLVCLAAKKGMVCVLAVYILQCIISMLPANGFSLVQQLLPTLNKSLAGHSGSFVFPQGTLHDASATGFTVGFSLLYFGAVLIILLVCGGAMVKRYEFFNRGGRA